MRRILFAAALIGTSFAAVSPAEAKSIWLKCGEQEINLDSAKERFSLTQLGKVYQGPAMFTPGQIDFEFQWFTYPGGGGIKSAYAIDRKSLGYVQTALHSFHLKPAWHEVSAPTAGKCSIMKTPPTTGNKI